MQVRLVLVAKQGEQPTDMTLGDAIAVEVSPERLIRIGRSGDVDIDVQASTVGRRVAQLSQAGAELWVQDLGSGGGSRLEVEGKVICRPDRAVPNGALLWIGEVGFRVEIGPA